LLSIAASQRHSGIAYYCRKFSSFILLTLQDAAKALGSKPYNAAELWELHQFYYSPPLSKCGVYPASSASVAPTARYIHDPIDSSDTDSSTPRARTFLRSGTGRSNTCNNSDDEDEDESDHDVKRYDHFKNRISQNHSSVSGAGGIVENICHSSSSQSGSKPPTHVSSRKRRATMSTMIRIAQFPKVMVTTSKYCPIHFIYV